MYSARIDIYYFNKIIKRVGGRCNMPMSCSVPGCTSRKKLGSTIKFLGYPFKNPIQLKQWVNAVGRTNWQPSPSSKICSLHFQETDFILGLGYQNTQLKQDVVPSIFSHTSGIKRYVNYDKENLNQVLKPSDLNSQDLPSRKKFAKVPLTENVNILSPVTSKSADKLPNDYPDKENFTQDTITSFDKQKEETTVTDNTQETYMVFPLLSAENSSSSNTSSPKTKALHKRIRTLSRSVKTLKQKIKRRDKKIRLMKDLFAQLKKKGLMDNDPLIIIKNQFEGMSLNIFKNELKNKNRRSSGRRYSDEIKEFALTLHYHSPKAYLFCRNILKLPHPSSIRNWMLSINAEPGFVKDVFLELSKLPVEDRDCNLVLDGMAIRKQIIWDQRRHCYTGYCDYGNCVRLEGAESEATEALAFMLVALNGKWKWPIGYFLKCRMTALTQAELVKTAVTLAKESGLKVWSVTCDGTSVNFSMFEQLGCKIFGYSFKDIESKFKHPSADYYVYAILDACHMLKLARNAFAQYQIFRSSDGSINWQLIVALHSLQRKLTFKFKNRLSNQCIAWYQNKMKVKYAAQTLSASVANALEFLEEEGELKDCGATVTFLRKIDRLFDFMNSRSPFGKGFKEPLKRSNLEYLSQIITEHIGYLFQLRDTHDQLLHTGPRKVFIYGFAVTAKSILDLAKNLFAENCSYKYLLTYKFSQDHLELLFARIRSRHGWNNNPNVIQFKYAMKQILMRNSLAASKSGNCIALDSDPVGSVFSFKWYKKDNDNDLYNNFYDNELVENNITSTEVEKLNSINSKMPLNNELRDNILYYIGGYVLKRVLPYIHCDSCVNSLILTQSEHNYSHYYKFSKFLELSQKGGLIVPSLSTHKIIVEAEKLLQLETNNLSNLKIEKLDTKIIMQIKKKFVFDESIFPGLACDNVGPLEMPHKLKLILAVTRFFLKVRLFSYGKFYTTEILMPIRKRHRLTKQILFASE